MSYQKFQELCEACYVTKEDAVEIYESDPLKPWSCPDNEKRRQDAARIFNEIFSNEDELDLNELSLRITAVRDRLQQEGVTDDMWGTTGNIRVAVAKAAALAVRTYANLLPEMPQLNPEEILTTGKKSPYAYLASLHAKKPRDGSPSKGRHHIDYEAAGMMYDGDMLALLIAREYEIEEYTP